MSRARAIGMALFLIGTLMANSCAKQRQSTEGAVAPTSSTVVVSPTAGGTAAPEVQTKAADLGNDSTKVLRFVSGELGYEAYEGAMRGSRGVMLAHAGNAADKSLLLHDLLKSADPQGDLQYAFCTLPDDQASQLAALALAYKGPPPSAASPPAVTPPVAADPQLQAAAERLANTFLELQASFSQAGAALNADLQRYGVALTTSVMTQPQLAKAAAHHVWLQRRESGNWVDLDPTLDSPGKRRCTPEQTSSEIPEGLYHHVDINVRMEQRIEGVLKSHDLLAAHLRTADLAGSSIEVLFAEPMGLDPSNGAASPPPAGVARYTPLLAINGMYRVGQPLDLPEPLTGLAREIADKARQASQVRAADQGALGGMTGRLSSASGSPAPSAAPTATPTLNPAVAALPEVTGVWLDLRIAGPNGVDRTVERPIFDRIGYAARSRHQAATARLAAVAEADHDYDGLLSIWDFVVWTGDSTNSIGPAFAVDARPDLSGDNDIFSAYHRGFYDLRRTLIASAKGTKGTRFVATGASVSLLTRHLAQGTDDTPAISLDRLDEQVGILQGEAAADGALPPGVLWGIASLYAERYLLLAPRATLAAQGAAAGAADIVDVSAVFDAARKNGSQIELLRPGDSARIASIAASDGARARLQERLDQGAMILVPQAAQTVAGGTALGWWVINAQGGMIEDEMEDGGHDAGVENAELQGQATSLSTRVARLGKVVKGAYCHVRRAFLIIASLLKLFSIWRKEPLTGPLGTVDPKDIKDIADTVLVFWGTSLLTVKCPEVPKDLPSIPLPVIH